MLSITNNMLSLAILILIELFLVCFHKLPNVLNAGEIFLSFGAIACESIEYVVIAFQNTSQEIF